MTINLGILPERVETAGTKRSHDCCHCHNQPSARGLRPQAPQADRFLAPDGSVLLTAGDIRGRECVVSASRLTNYGSIYGMGSYFGPDAVRSRAGVLHRWITMRARMTPPSTFRAIQWLHRILFALSLITVFGAIAGSHGF